MFENLVNYDGSETTTFVTRSSTVFENLVNYDG